MKKILTFIDEKPFPTAALLAAVMNIVISCLHARSLIGGVGALLAHPISGLFNFWLLLICYAATLFFKRRVFAFSTVTLLWLTVGVINCVLLGMRITPLQAIDFYIVRTGIAIIDVYMTPFAMVLAALGILLAIALIVWLFIKAPKCKPDLFHAMLVFLCVMLVLILFSLAFIGLGNADPGKFDDIKDAYDIYGFPYCFLRSFFDRGIEQPSGYSEATVNELLASLPENTLADMDDRPSIVFVQLESFFDITRMNGITLSSDPIPNFRRLCREGISGLFRVPGIGSGTANTEFKVLTGLDTDFFGTGEYPYESILQKTGCETIAFDLGALGYATHAMHNHTGTFYDRYRVYANLGFDDFTGAEHMKDITYNELGWEKDEILTPYILKALNSTKQSDFVFAVSVEGHGGYPDLPTGDTTIKVSGLADPAEKNAYTYYANTIHSMDAFIGKLASALAEREEEVLLVLYGDHLPAIGIEESALREGSIVNTDYVIWSNKQLPVSPQRLDMTATELFPYVLNLYSLGDGIIPRIHSAYDETSQRMDKVKLIGYDSLYGDRLAYGEHFPFLPKSMKMGLDEILITHVSGDTENGLFIHGRNFTPASVVLVDGRQMNTVFLTEETLYIANAPSENAKSIAVAQISADLRILSRTEAFLLTADDFLLN